MKQIRAFTLIEILVAMLVGSFAVLLASDLISNQTIARSQFKDNHMTLEFEAALKILRSDIEASVKSADGTKNVNFVLDESSGITLSLKKPVYSAGTQNIEVVSVSWAFSKNSVVRSINNDDKPLIIRTKQMEYRLEELQDNVFYFSSESADNNFASVLDLR